MPRSRPSILHVDMDAFFASVEILERPELADKPVIVGGDGTRGVVASCNYQARRFGVRSAMPSMRAKALCPHAVFLLGRYGEYEKYSRLMHDVFHSFTPIVEGISIDEAFLDVDGATRLFGSPEDIAWAIRKKVFDEMKLHVSVGGATTKHVAKLASEAAKPKADRKGVTAGKGVYVVAPDDSIEFLQSLPVRALWGVGPVTATKLQRLSIETVRQLAQASTPALVAAVGTHTANHLQNLAWNRDDRTVETSRAAKSIGHEQTFSRDLYSEAVIHEKIVRLADAVASRLRKSEVAGRTVTLKVRFTSFETITRSTTLPEAAASAGLLIQVVSESLKNLDLSPGVRLIGISVSNLEHFALAEQMSFDEALPDNTLDRTIDEIRMRYGSTSVVPALLVREGRPAVLKPGERQWGPSKEDDRESKQKPQK